MLCAFAGTPVEVGITMYVLSISSLSEVKMVHVNATIFLYFIFRLLLYLFVCVLYALSHDHTILHSFIYLCI
jgi:hypothetical protein